MSTILVTNLFQFQIHPTFKVCFICHRQFRFCTKPVVFVIRIEWRTYVMRFLLILLSTCYYTTYVLIWRVNEIGLIMLLLIQNFVWNWYKDLIFQIIIPSHWQWTIKLFAFFLLNENGLIKLDWLTHRTNLTPVSEPKSLH